MQKNEGAKSYGREFFAAANSGKGFVSFYREIFDSKNIERRYLIKGGPGTGKSTFMRRAADEAVKNGMEIEYYRCSSDPASLDGIIINGRVAVMDSTAPHAQEAELVGARDVLVDLGAFWNSDGLFAERERISDLSLRKKRSYAQAYRFLSSAMQSDVASREVMIPYVDSKRLARFARRLMRGIESDGGYECKIGLSKAIGMSGRCTLDTYSRLARDTTEIDSYYGIGYLVLCAICEEARERGCRITVSYEPLTPDVPSSVLFEESGRLFNVPEAKSKAISPRHVLDISSLSKKERTELKAKSRHARRLSSALVLAAVDELRLAGESHFELEKIYRANMDFEGLDVFTSNLIEKIIKNAQKE